jgi:hypothetical protein
MMVNPIKKQIVRISKTPAKKKPIKEIDLRVKKIIKKTRLEQPEKAGSFVKASQKIAIENARLSAEKASAAARTKTFESRKAAVIAQKKYFLSQRAHMAQQAAAARRARAEEKTKKAAERAAKKTAFSRRAMTIKAYIAKPTEKKRDRLLKKYLRKEPKKKKNS